MRAIIFKPSRLFIDCTIYSFTSHVNFFGDKILVHVDFVKYASNLHISLQCTKITELNLLNWFKSVTNMRLWWPTITSWLNIEGILNYSLTSNKKIVTQRFQFVRLTISLCSPTVKLHWLLEVKYQQNRNFVSYGPPWYPKNMCNTP